MTWLTEGLPIILNVLAIILLIILIIIGLKTIKLINNVRTLFEDLIYKIKSLNGVFRAIDNITDSISNLSDKITTIISNFIIKIFKKKYNKNKEESENE